MAKKIAEGKYYEAINRLLLQLANVHNEKPQQAYDHLHSLLNRFDLIQWEKLRETNLLFPFLERTWTFKSEQGLLAKDMALWLENYAITSNDFQKTTTLSEDQLKLFLFEAMHSFAQAGKLGALADNGEKECSKLLFKTVVAIQLSRRKERLKNFARTNSLTDFRKELLSLFELRRFCCFDEAFPILEKLYDELNDLILSIKGNRENLPALLENEMATHFVLSAPITQKYRKALNKWRTVFAVSNLPPESVRLFQKSAFEKFQLFFSVLLEDAIRLVGPVPGLYDIRALGSFGREELCPFSPLELVVLYQHESDKKYFEQLLFFLNLQVHSLGEIKYPFYFTALGNCSGFHLLKIDTFTPQNVSENSASILTTLLMLQEKLID